MTNNIISIHQPNLFPWLGYFNKILHSNKFILLDNVQFSKKGGTWTNRVKIVINGEANWMTIPIIRNYHGTLLTNEIKIDNNLPWRKKILNMIRTNYGKASYFEEVYPLLLQIFNTDSTNLVRFNIFALNSILMALGIENEEKFVLASELKSKGDGTDLLISLVHEVGGDSYLCGGGASGYQEDHKFKQMNIHLIYQNFEHPTYNQFNTKNFIPGLSILDPLMNIGIKSTRVLLKV